MAKRILVVDDSAATRSFYKIFLGFADHDLLEAEDGDRALRVMRVARVDLVIADINMPRLDGISFVRRVRGSDQPELRAVPIILVTGDKSEAIEASAMLAGATHLLRKPVSSETLVDMVERILGPSGPPPSAPRSSRGAP
jgi:two-component system chemotaxis response regulator CheY